LVSPLPHPLGNFSAEPLSAIFEEWYFTIDLIIFLHRRKRENFASYLMADAANTFPCCLPTNNITKEAKTTPKSENNCLTETH